MPRTRFSFKNLYSLKKYEKEIIPTNEFKDVGEIIEYASKNYFDKKEKFLLKNFELNDLDISLLKTKKGKEEEFRALAAKDDPLKAKLNEFYTFNNKTILENFELLVVRNIVDKIKVIKAGQYLEDDIIQSSFYAYVGLKQHQLYDMIFV